MMNENSCERTVVAVSKKKLFLVKNSSIIYVHKFKLKKKSKGNLLAALFAVQFKLYELAAIQSKQFVKKCMECVSFA